MPNRLLEGRLKLATNERAVMLILRGHTDAVRCLSYSPDGRWLASGSEDKTVHLWDLANYTPAVLEREISVEALAFRPDGLVLATGDAVGALLVCDMPRRLWRSCFHAHTGGIRDLAFAPDGQTLAATGWDQRVTCWEIAALKQRRSFHVDLSCSALAYAPDGRTLAVGLDDGGIQWFDRGGNRLGRVEGPFRLFAMAWSPDGRLLASGHSDGTIALWKDDQLQATLRGHTWTIYALAFTPDGNMLISGCADGTVRLWDVARRCERRCYRWHTSWVTCLAVAPDGMTAAAGSADHTVVVWDLDDD